MAEQGNRAIDKQAVFIAEAGTGTGKTFCLPGAGAGSPNGKVIVSTGTKTLQDQLFNKDLPMVRHPEGAGQDRAAQGRANYVCPYHLTGHCWPTAFLTREDAADARRISVFAKTTQTGDKAECIEVNETPGLEQRDFDARQLPGPGLARTTRNVSSCRRARRRWRRPGGGQSPPVLFADVMLRDEGMAELPGLQHGDLRRSPPVAGSGDLFFGDSGRPRRCSISPDAKAEGLTSARDCLDIQTRRQGHGKGGARPAPGGPASTPAFLLRTVAGKAGIRPGPEGAGRRGRQPCRHSRNPGPARRGHRKNAGSARSNCSRRSPNGRTWPISATCAGARLSPSRCS